MALTPAERRRRNAIELLNMAMLMAATSGSSTETVAVLTLVDDGLETATPYYTFSSTAAGTLRWDFHSSATPPAAGSGDLGTGTQSVSSGNTVFSIDLSPYPGTGYLHFRVINSAGTSNILTSQVITVSSGWTPADLGAGLIGWWDASDSGSLTLSGADVTQWNDKSGNANHLTQGTAGRYPQYSATGFNTSYPCLSFLGGDWLTKASFALGADATSSCVAICTLDTGVNGGRLVCMSDDTNQNDYTGGGVMWFYQPSSGSVDFYGYMGGDKSGVTAGSTGTPYVMTSVYDGTNHTMYRGSTAGSAVAAVDTTDATGTLAVGVAYEAGPVTAKSWQGKVAEIFIVNRALTAQDRTDILTYAAEKWGLGVLFRSSDLSTGWTNDGTTETVNTTNAPDSTLTADSLTDTATTAAHRIYNSFTATAAPHTFSVYLKQDTGRYAQVQLAIGGNNYGVIADLQTGTITDTKNTGASGVSHSIASAANGFYKVSVTLTASAATWFPVISLSDSATPVYDANNNPTYAGSGSLNVFVWDAKVVGL